MCCRPALDLELTHLDALQILDGAAAVVLRLLLRIAAFCQLAVSEPTDASLPLPIAPPLTPHPAPPPFLLLLAFFADTCIAVRARFPTWQAEWLSNRQDDPDLSADGYDQLNYLRLFAKRLPAKTGCKTFKGELALASWLSITRECFSRGVARCC